MYQNIMSVVNDEFQHWLDRVAKEFAERELGYSALKPKSIGWKDLDQKNKNDYLNRVYQNLNDTGFQSSEVDEIKNQIGQECVNFTYETGFKILALCLSGETNKATVFENTDELKNEMKERGINISLFEDDDLKQIIKSVEDLYDGRKNPEQAGNGGYDTRHLS